MPARSMLVVRGRSSAIRKVTNALLGLALLGTGGAWAPAVAVTFSQTVIDARGPSQAWGKAVGDLNGDGRTDIVIGSRNGGLYWYQNPGWTKRRIAGTQIQEDMDVVDLDRNGRRDIVAVVTGGITWFAQTGGSWSPRAIVRGRELHDVEVRDLDGDGKLDLVARNQGPSGNQLYLWRQVSLTSWQASSIRLPEGGEGLRATDIDRDGKPDLVVGKYWLKNNSSRGRFSFARYLYGGGAAANGYIAVGDVNRDGREDIVVSPAEPAGRRHDVSWFEAPVQRTGRWIEHVLERNVESVVHFCGIADFDRNGQSDIVTAMTQKGGNPKIKVYMNISNRNAAGSTATVADTSSHSMKLLVVDGRPSLVGADYANPGATPIRLWSARP